MGSVVALVNNQGQVVGRLGYDSYGKVIQHQGTLPDYQYAGLYAHTESGLYLATYRAYNPETARWLSRDPIRELGGINLYSYSLGNPLTQSDPYGLAVTFGHGARHLAGTGLSSTAVESAITGAILPIMPYTTPGCGFWGVININGISIQYRAMPLGGGVHVGTYFPW
ncbi:RHS repeat-associated core domain-containing protein [Halothiobacillus diazotrophicus]|uniref:RHS repeat-associated core domain-containing protein n=1 Tax=Halothiobacillus diazotrophicus TaxID=1860122 RepID=UPI003898D735